MKKARPTSKADETAEFLAYWAVWQPHMHKNDGRGSARDEFFRQVEELRADPQDIADGAAWYIRNRGPEDWMPHAATWLYRRAYEDGAEKEREFRAKLAERQSDQKNIVPMRRTEIPTMSEEEKQRREQFVNTVRRQEG